MKPSLKLIRTIFLVLCALGTAGIVCSRYMGIPWMLYAGIGIFLVALAVYIMFYKCPHCGEFLSKDVDGTCKHCGKKVS